MRFDAHCGCSVNGANSRMRILGCSLNRLLDGGG